MNIKDSQNFLHDNSLVNKIINLSNITKKDIVIEIGPGKGIITGILEKKCKQLIAVEYDKNLYEELNKNNYENTKIINDDFLNYEFNNENKYKIFSNIPFNLTTEIFNKILENYNLIEDFYIIMQKEAAYRYIGYPNESFKSLLFKPVYSSEIIYEFKETDFHPIPNIDIVLVHFHKKEYCDIKNVPLEMYFDMLSYIFNENGSAFKEKTKNVFTYKQLKRLSKPIKLDVNTNITSITYNQWLEIFNSYKQFVQDDKKQKIKGSYIKHNKEQKKLEKIIRTRI